MNKNTLLDTLKPIDYNNLRKDLQRTMKLSFWRKTSHEIILFQIYECYHYDCGKLWKINSYFSEFYLEPTKSTCRKIWQSVFSKRECDEKWKITLWHSIFNSNKWKFYCNFKKLELIWLDTKSLPCNRIHVNSQIFLHHFATFVWIFIEFLVEKRFTHYTCFTGSLQIILQPITFVF